jgi:hypothetical protein
MKSYLKHLTGALLSITLAFGLFGCGGDSNQAATGPSGPGAFAGSSISFNPTVNFLAGNAMIYVNTTPSSAFPAAASPGTAGTYTYTPGPNFTSGTLTLSITGNPDIVLEVSGFIQSGGNVTGFTVRSGGQNYPVTVTGTIVAYTPPAAGGGGSSAGLVNATSDISLATQGTYELTFLNAFGEGRVAGSPYDTGDRRNFIIGPRELTVVSTRLTNPRNPISSPTDFIYQDGSVWYWVYGNRTPVQINVYGGNPTQAGGTFYGSFRPASSGGPVTLLVSVDGTGKFTSGSSFQASITTTTPAVIVGPAYPAVFELASPTFFGVALNGDLQVSANSMVYNVPFLSATPTTVTYQLSETGSPNRNYSVVITKDSANKPTTIEASFSHSSGSVITTRAYTLTTLP